MQSEIKVYENVQTEVLKLANINKQIWETSITHYLQGNEKFIRKVLKQSTNSPFTFHGNETADDIIHHFVTSTQWALDMLS